MRFPPSPPIYQIQFLRRAVSLLFHQGEINFSPRVAAFRMHCALVRDPICLLNPPPPASSRLLSVGLYQSFRITTPTAGRRRRRAAAAAAASPAGLAAQGRDGVIGRATFSSVSSGPVCRTDGRTDGRGKGARATEDAYNETALINQGIKHTGVKIFHLIYSLCSTRNDFLDVCLIGRYHSSPNAQCTSVARCIILPPQREAAASVRSASTLAHSTFVHDRS